MFRYEMHLHTSVTSLCSHFLPQEIVEKYTRLGYTGLFVTDHFMRGNCSVPRELPWQEQVERFFDGYESVKDAAAGRLDVFFAFEYSYWGTDFLVFGLGKDWIKSHPEIMTMSVKEFCRLARGDGGMIVQAHPYREANYIDHIRLFPREIDGVEVINTANGTKLSNSLSEFLAKAYGLPESAGSDIHGGEQKMLAGLEFEAPLTSVQDFMQRFLKREGKLFVLEDKGVV